VDEFEGIIIRHMDYKESSQIIHVYTEKGLISCLLHGANKMKSPFLASKESLSHVKIIASGKGLKTVKEMDVLHSFPLIKSQLDKYTYVLHMLELIHHFADGELNHEKAYPFLIKIINKVELETDYVPYINMFEAKLLYLLGVNPLFHECVICKDIHDLTFSIEEGGMTCNNHTLKKQAYSQACIELFEFLYYYDLQNPSSIETEMKTIMELRHLLDEYYLYHLNIKTKSRTVLEGFIGY